MMVVYLNGERVQAEEKEFLEAFLVRQGVRQECCAVAINEKFIPRLHYAKTRLLDQAVIELVIPMQGG